MARWPNTVYFGAPLAQAADYAGVAAQANFCDTNAGFYPNAYTPAGTWSLGEPAIEVTHADGNPSLELHYVSHAVTQPDAHSTLTRVRLRDPAYPFKVTRCYRAWTQESMLEQWAESVHHDKKPVLLQKYASANRYFTQQDFYLTTFQGRYAREMQPAETRLAQGTRSVGSVLGTRAVLLQTPNFVLSFGQPARENEELVVLGQLAWSGNFQLSFEVDFYRNLRLLAGINPLASACLPTAGRAGVPSAFFGANQPANRVSPIIPPAMQVTDFPLLLNSSAMLTAARDYQALFRALDKLQPLFGFSSFTLAVEQPGGQHLHRAQLPPTAANPFPQAAEALHPNAGSPFPWLLQQPAARVMHVREFQEIFFVVEGGAVVRRKRRGTWPACCASWCRRAWKAFSRESASPCRPAPSCRHPR